MYMYSYCNCSIDGISTVPLKIKYNAKLRLYEQTVQPYGKVTWK